MFNVCDVHSATARCAMCNTLNEFIFCSIMQIENALFRFRFHVSRPLHGSFKQNVCLADKRL